MNEPTTQAAAEAERLRDALKFYADWRNYDEFLSVGDIDEAMIGHEICKVAEDALASTATPPPAPAGQAAQWTVDAARQCFPYKTNEAEIKAIARIIADCLPAEVAAAVRLVELLNDNEAVIYLHGLQRVVRRGFSGWRIETVEGNTDDNFIDLAGAVEHLAALTGDGEGKNDGSL